MAELINDSIENLSQIKSLSIYNFTEWSQIINRGQIWSANSTQLTAELNELKPNDWMLINVNKWWKVAEKRAIGCHRKC